MEVDSSEQNMAQEVERLRAQVAYWQQQARHDAVEDAAADSENDPNLISKNARNRFTYMLDTNKGARDRAVAQLESALRNVDDVLVDGAALFRVPYAEASEEDEDALPSKMQRQKSSERPAPKIGVSYVENSFQVSGGNGDNFSFGGTAPPPPPPVQKDPTPASSDEPSEAPTPEVSIEGEADVLQTVRAVVSSGGKMPTVVWEGRSRHTEDWEVLAEQTYPTPFVYTIGAFLEGHILRTLLFDESGEFIAQSEQSEPIGLTDGLHRVIKNMLHSRKTKFKCCLSGQEGSLKLKHDVLEFRAKKRIKVPMTRALEVQPGTSPTSILVSADGSSAAAMEFEFLDSYDRDIAAIAIRKFRDDD